MVQDPLALILLEVEIPEGTVIRVVPGEGLGEGPDGLKFLMERAIGDGG